MERDKQTGAGASSTQEMVKHCFSAVGAPVAICNYSLNILWRNPYLEKNAPMYKSLRNLKELWWDLNLADIQRTLRTGQEVSIPTSILPSTTTAEYIRLVPAGNGEDSVVIALFPVAGPQGISFLTSENANRIISTYSAAYRTDLTSIFSTLSPLARRLEEHADYEGQKLLDRVNKSAYQMLRMGGNMTEVAKYVTGTNTFTPKRTEMASFLKTLCDGIVSLVDDSSVPLTYKIEFDSLAMYIDQQKISQVISNLISNSILFTRDGNKVHLRAEITGGDLTITVQDRGHGIDPQCLPFVFNPHYSHKPGDGGFSSAGLGLTICHYAVTMHGGNILLTSVPGEGTTVKFTIPISDGDEEEHFHNISSFDLLGNRYSSLYVDLADVCKLPYP